jgi:hypothetical protein
MYLSTTRTRRKYRTFVGAVQKVGGRNCGAVVCSAQERPRSRSIGRLAGNPISPYEFAEHPMIARLATLRTDDVFEAWPGRVVTGGVT